LGYKHKTLSLFYNCKVTFWVSGEESAIWDMYLFFRREVKVRGQGFAFPVLCNYPESKGSKAHRVKALPSTDSSCGLSVVPIHYSLGTEKSFNFK
jgi:hypothetical protein